MRFLTLALVALLGLGSPALAQQHYVAQPSASELQAADVLLVDIRRPEEWKQTGVLPNAHLLTYEQFRHAKRRFWKRLPRSLMAAPWPSSAGPATAPISPRALWPNGWTSR